MNNTQTVLPEISVVTVESLSHAEKNTENKLWDPYVEYDFGECFTGITVIS